MPDRPAGPPEIAQGFEACEGALARFDRFLQPSGKQVDLGQTGFGKGFDFVQTGRRRKRCCLVAMIDRYIQSASCQAVQKAAPIMPGRAAAWVVALVDEIADLVEGMDVLGMLSEREFDFGLLDDGIDTTQ